MVITQRHGLLVEGTNPTKMLGIQHCWISDKRENSPTKDQILVHATGKTLAEAVENATNQLETIMTQ